MALGFLLVVALVNVRGMGESVKASVVCTVISILGLLAIAVIGVAFLLQGDGDLGRALEFTDAEAPVFALAGGGRQPSLLRAHISASRTPSNS